MQAILSKNLSRRTVVARCENQPQRFNLTTVFPLLNSETAKKRNASIKENLNKLIAIGTADLKECYDLAVELDNAHKEALNFGKDKKDTKPVESSDSDGNDENIFLKQDS